MPMLAALGAASTWAIGTLYFNRALRAPDGAGGNRALRARDEAGGRSAPSAAAANLFKNALGTGVFALVALLLGVAWPESSAWPALLLSGAMGFTLGDGLYFAALPHLGAQRTAMLVQLNVPVSAISSAIFYGERFPPLLVLAMAVVVAGVLVVVRADAPSEGSSDVSAAQERAGITRRAVSLGVWCALGAVLFQSAGSVVGHGLMEGESVLASMVVRILGGVLASFVVVPAFALFTGGAPRRELARLVEPFRARSQGRDLWIAACFGALFGLPLFHYGLRELDTGVGMVLFSTTPLFTLPLTSFFGERHGVRAWWGTALGFAGVVAVVVLQHGRG